MGLAGSECVRAKIKFEDFYVHVRPDAGISSIIRARVPISSSSGNYSISFGNSENNEIFIRLSLFIRLSNFDSKFIRIYFFFLSFLFNKLDDKHDRRFTIIK